MREVTRLMINDFKIMELGCDFAGYKLVNESDVSFHHYLIARRDCKKLGLGEGYTYQNGVILNAKTSHPELHLIESKEEKLFYYIKSQADNKSPKRRAIKIYILIKLPLP